MKNNMSVGRTGLLVLQILKDYGTLHVTAIARLMNYAHTQEALRHSLKSLERHGLIIRRTWTYGHNGLHFYQLSQSVRAFSEIARILGCNANELCQKGLRFSHYFHESDVALAAYAIGRSYPEALVFQDWKLNSQPELHRLLSDSIRRLKALPDLMVKFPAVNSNLCDTWIGVEVERSRKTNARIKEKLSLLANKSGLDGVIYLTTQECIMKQLQLIYLGLRPNQSPRIKHYGEGFLAYATLPTNSFAFHNLSVLVNECPLLAGEWISNLRETHILDRRNFETNGHMVAPVPNKGGFHV